MNSNADSLIVGIGSAHGDDQIGWLVADEVVRLVAQSDQSQHIMIHKVKSPIDVLNWLDENETFEIHQLFLCDACHGLFEPGQTHRWAWPASELDNTRFSGSHDFGLTSVLQLAQRLDRLPERVIIWGVQVERVQPGTHVSPQLRRVPKQLAREMLQSAMELQTDNTPVSQRSGS